MCVCGRERERETETEKETETETERQRQRLWGERRVENDLVEARHTDQKLAAGDGITQAGLWLAVAILTLSLPCLPACHPENDQ